MTKLALLRHGHTAWNRAGRIQGRTDIPLDDDAREGLSLLRLPPPWDQADLWSSPLARAKDTAVLVSGRPPRTAPELTEMNWGQWEGLQGANLLADPDCAYTDIENWGWDFRPPEGESPADLRARLGDWIATLAENGTDAVAVCHIGIMRVLLAMAMDWNFQGPAPFRIKRNRLFVLHITPDGLEAQPEPIRLIAAQE
jgi:probable phosphoglycerate mutase